MILPIWTSCHQAEQDRRLSELLERVKSDMEKDTSSLAIFDLDGTLFDNRPRTNFILTEIASRYDDRLPQLCNAMDRFRDINLFQYSVRETLKNLNVTDEKEIEVIEREWKERFFSDEYQKYDTPYPGAAKYVSKLHSAGATIIYLTGRDAPKMLVGAIDSLRMFGFPVGISGTMTIVKQAFEDKDEIFKKNVAAYLRRIGKVEGIFENEPANSNLLKESFPDALSFFVLSQHREDAPPLDEGICVIKDFRYKKR